MSVDAIGRVTQALRGIIQGRLVATGVETSIFVGSPGLRPAGGDMLVSLFLFHLEPNREMRNVPRAINAVGASEPIPQNALPLDLRYMISFFRAIDGAASNIDDQLRLGHVIAALHDNPTIGEGMVPGQSVRLMPEPYPMEEISRIWGLFPNTHYMTSIVYLASPVFIDASATLRGGPVISRRYDAGHSMKAPDVFGRGQRDMQEGAG